MSDATFATLLPLAIAVPLLVAALMVSFASMMTRILRDFVLLATTLFSVGVSFALLAHTLDGVPIAYWVGGFGPAHDVAPGIALYVDPPAAAVLAMVGAIFAAVTFYAWRYFKTVEEYIHVMLLVLQGAMIALVMAADIFTMFVAFELMSVIAYALTAFKIEDEDALTGAFTFAMLGSIASLMMMTGIAFVYAEVGSLNLAEISRSLAGGGNAIAATGLAMVVGGLLFKLAAVPFHFWIADADVAAPSPVAAISSGAMTVVAAFWIARLTGTVIGPLSPAIGAAFDHILLAIGLATVWLGSILSLYQTNLKRLLAFSTIAHMGVALLGFGIGGAAALAGTGLYILCQGLVKAALFLLTGAVLQRYGVMDVRAIRDEAEPSRWLGVALIVGGFALAGAPPFGLWAGKTMLEEALPSGVLGEALLVTLIASAVLTGGAVIHAALVAFFGIGQASSRALDPTQPDEPTSDTECETGELDRIPFTLVAAPIGLLGVAAIVPFLPDAIGHARQMAEVLLDAGAFRGALFGSHTVAIGVHAEPIPQVTTSIVVAICALIVPIGWALAKRWRGADPLSPIVTALRAGHSALLNDYALWLIGGFAMLMGWTLLAL